VKTTVICQYHPAAALHNPRLWSVMLDDWEHLPQQVDHDYVVVPSTAIPNVKTLALDTESADSTGGLGIWSVAYRDENGRIAVTPFYGCDHRPTFRDDQQVIMHYAKHDLRVLEKAGLPQPKNVVDTIIAAYCLGLGRQDVKTEGRESDTGLVGGLGLKYLGRRHLGMNMKTWDDVKDKPELVPAYNADDSVATLLLWEKWKPILPEHFWKIDMLLMRTLMAMEDRGIMLDPKFLATFSENLDADLAKYSFPFDPFSPKQVGEYIYKTLGIEPFRFTETGQPSADAEVLESIDDPVIKRLLEYKHLYQERNTYVKNYLEGMTPEGRIKCEFKQIRTATGRLSSAHPNLQNVPREGNMRNLFIAPEGMLLVRADWIQIELLCIAIISGDEAMLDVFAKGGDIHQATADALGVDRNRAKTINFMMQYIADEKDAAWKLSSETGLTIDEARLYVSKYFGQYRGMKRWVDDTVEQVKTTHRVKDWFGRERRIDAAYAEDWRVRKQGFREGVNMPIQGTAGEIVKIAMNDLHYKHSAPMLLQVHDELVFEVPTKDARDYGYWLRDYLPTLTEIKGMRFPVEVGVGRTWKEAMNKDNRLK
jgi:DNA polymerase-1